MALPLEITNADVRRAQALGPLLRELGCSTKEIRRRLAETVLRIKFGGGSLQETRRRIREIWEQGR